MNSWRLSHPRRPLLWLAVALGGTLLLALLLAQAVRAVSHPARLTTLALTQQTETGVPVVLMQSDGMTTGLGDTETMYTATVYDARNAPVDKITVAPMSVDDVATTPSDADTTVDGHQVNLGIGPTTIKIVVTSEDEQTTRTYTVKVTRISASNANLSELSLGDDGPSLSPAFDADTTSYVANVANDVENATVTVAATTLHTDASATPTPSGTVTLATGDNIIRVVTTSADGTQTMIYTVTVTRAKSDDATLTGIALSATGADLAPTFVAATTSYTASVANDVVSTNVTATKADTEAKDPVISPRDADSGTSGHQVNLAVGANTITVMVEAEDGSTETYTVTVTRGPAPSDADLTNLSLMDGTEPVPLSPGFMEGITSYTATVSDGLNAPVERVTVTAESDDAVAITPGDDDDADGHQVDLAVGETHDHHQGDEDGRNVAGLHGQGHAHLGLQRLPRDADSVRGDAGAEIRLRYYVLHGQR